MNNTIPWMYGNRPGVLMHTCALARTCTGPPLSPLSPHLQTNPVTVVQIKHFGRFRPGFEIIIKSENQTRVFWNKRSESAWDIMGKKTQWCSRAARVELDRNVNLTKTLSRGIMLSEANDFASCYVTSFQTSMWCSLTSLGEVATLSPQVLQLI